jgi:hypothetical protein
VLWLQRVVRRSDQSKPPLLTLMFPVKETKRAWIRALTPTVERLIPIEQLEWFATPGLQLVSPSIGDNYGKSFKNLNKKKLEHQMIYFFL